jgi:peroxiredoxin
MSVTKEGPKGETHSVEVDGNDRVDKNLQAAERRRVRLPGLKVEREVGLGDLIERVTSAIGIKPCGGCKRRAARLNRWMKFSAATREGVKVATRPPHLRLPDLQGRVVSLEEYRGRRVLLVFTDPQCEACDELAPYLISLHRQRQENGLAVILVGRGNAEENRRKAQQHGFQFPVMIQGKRRLSKKFGIFETPFAYLVGEDGVITRDVAVGRDAVLRLLCYVALESYLPGL